MGRSRGSDRGVGSRRLSAVASVVGLAVLLAGCGGGAPEQAPPELPLNHVMLVVEPETYAAVRDSAFLSDELAAVRERSTVADGGESWMGVYVYGAHTYIELFESNPNDLSEGSALALAVEHRGGLRRVAEMLGAGREATPEIRERFKVRDAERVPWFSWVGIGSDAPDATFWPWVMEYDPGYLRLWYGDGAESGITRAEHQSRVYAPGRLLVDVVGVTAVLDETEAASLARDLETLGWSVSRDGASRVLAGPGLELRVEPAGGDEHGIVGLRLALKRPVPEAPRVVRLGESTLTFHPDEAAATWSFR